MVPGARIDAAGHWQTCWRAIACHRSQRAGYDDLLALPEERQRALWGDQRFDRAFSLVSGGRAQERDLCKGLRHRAWARAWRPPLRPVESAYALAAASNGALPTP